MKSSALGIYRIPLLPFWFLEGLKFGSKIWWLGFNAAIKFTHQSTSGTCFSSKETTLLSPKIRSSSWMIKSKISFFGGWWHSTFEIS